VEDCSGTLYCMSETDDEYLANLNTSRKPGLAPITEDEFETIMDLYESAIQQTQPYLSMDVTNIIPFEELEHAFEETLDPPLKIVAKQIYSYWREQKVNRSGRTIIPCLKVGLILVLIRSPPGLLLAVPCTVLTLCVQFEQGEKDDGDPYVCFRRREVRQVRKTRRTDASSTDKLKKIRQEFETARGLVKDVLQREHMRRTTFLLEKQIFEQRRTAVDLKKKLNIKDTDEDLINKVGVGVPTSQAFPVTITNSVIAQTAKNGAPSTPDPADTNPPRWEAPGCGPAAAIYSASRRREEEAGEIQRDAKVAAAGSKVQHGGCDDGRVVQATRSQPKTSVELLLQRTDSLSAEPSPFRRVRGVLAGLRRWISSRQDGLHHPGLGAENSCTESPELPPTSRSWWSYSR